MGLVRRLLLWAVAVVFPLPLVLVYDTVATEPVGLKQLVLFGLIAYCWWLLSILLSVRPRWLERLVGLPAIYGVHGMLGFLALVLAYLHAENSYTSDALARVLGDSGLYGAIATMCLAVFFLTGLLVDRSRLLMDVKRFLERTVFRHQVSVWLHRVNLIVLGCIWLHVQILDRMNQYPGFLLLFNGYTAVALGAYAWKKWIAPRSHATGTVTANEALGDSSRRIDVELDRTDPSIRPGDFFFLSVEDSSAVDAERHPFSVTTDDQRALSFTVRQHGDYTRRAGGIGTGTRVRLEGPFGRFASIIDRHDPDAPLVLLGMGAGVAPLLSIVAAHCTTRDIRVLWAVSTLADAYYGDVLAAAGASSGGRLRTSVRVGRFQREHLDAELSAREIESGAFFVVGPNPAVLASRRLLRRLGVASSRLHDERLTM